MLLPSASSKLQAGGPCHEFVDFPQEKVVQSLMLPGCFDFFACKHLFVAQSWAAPKVVVISLDGATPRIVNNLLRRGVLPRQRGIGALRRNGFFAEQNIVIAPSLTAASHVAIATGSTAAHNDVVSNTFHLVASPFTSNISGFSAPIGGYSIDGPSREPESDGISHLAFAARGRQDRTDSHVPGR